MTEQERVIEEAKEQARAELKAEYDAKILRSRILAAAADVLNDPNDAALYISDLDPEASEDEVRAAVTLLAKEKPYLAKKPAAPPISQGQRGDGVSNDDAEDWLRGTLRSR